MLWKLVPVVPTQKMLDAGTENNPTVWDDYTGIEFSNHVADAIYRSMIKTAPGTGRICHDMHDALVTAHKALDIAECTIDADADVESFHVVRHAKKIVRVVLASLTSPTDSFVSDLTKDGREEVPEQQDEALSSSAVAVMTSLFFCGPTEDGNIPSKPGRQELVSAGYCRHAHGHAWLTDKGVRRAIEDYQLDAKKERWRHAGNRAWDQKMQQMPAPKTRSKK